ncbi:MAG: class II fructose-bisphosphate aldolase [Acidimicrobiales bacterium]|jgi:fructose-bisphosphate aldolase class II
MPLEPLTPLLEEALAKSYVVGSFNAFNLETVRAVVQAAEELRSPVVVAVAASHLEYMDFDALADASVPLCRRARVPVALHLDHAETLDVVARAIRAGFTSVMFDGYGLSQEEKWRQTRSVTDLAHSIGISVEAELGHITKVGVDREQRDELLIDPSLAGDFVSATGVDVVAAAIGSVHGQQSGEARLDFARLTELREKVQCQLSLHGGSGMAENDVEQAIAAGIAKISYFTGLSRDAVDRATDLLAADPDVRLTVLFNEMRQAFQAGVRRQLSLYRSAGMA